MDRLILYLQEGFRDLRKNKARTFLTSLGIIIGVYSVVLLMSLGEGIKVYIQQQFQALGSDIIYVMPYKIEDALQDGVFNKRFSAEDYRKIKQQVRGEINPAIEFAASIQKNDINKKITMLGTGEGFFDLLQLSLSSGRGFSRTETSSGQRVVVIGSKLKTTFFPHSPALGESLLIDDLKFRIIGVLNEKGIGGIGGNDLDMRAFVPTKTAQQITGDTGYMMLYAKKDQGSTQDGFVAHLKRVMRRYYKEDEFSVSTQEDLLSTTETIFNAINGVLIGIAAISLVVGGVGIMNIMYVTLTERTREIGIRRALGARKHDILIQFLILSILLTGIGGLIGLLLAWGTTLIIQRWFPATITPIMPIVAFGVSTIIGLIFGVLPARKAALVSPLEAIRSE